MNQAASPQPRPGQVPTLTEVIELRTPAPVREEGMNNAPRPEAPTPGSPDAAPIVTKGLAAGGYVPAWSPMTTVVVPPGEARASHPFTLPLADLPVLKAEVPALSALPELPQLNEVVPEPEEASQAPAPSAASAAMPEINEAQLAQRVLSDVQRQIDGMLEFRLREAMAPLLARHSEALLRDLREELSRTMRDVVARSVAQEVAKLRQR